MTWTEGMTIRGTAEDHGLGIVSRVGIVGNLCVVFHICLLIFLILSRFANWALQQISIGK